MPKPKSLGFPYFSQDTDTFQDVKIRLLISQHGCAGYTVWEYLKQAAYRENGYYVEWNDERKELAAADLYLGVEHIGLIVAYLLKRSLLVSKFFNGVTVLTSHGIQKRFQEMAKAAKRDYYKFLPEVWLLSDEETYHSIFCTHLDDNSGIKGDNSGIKGDNSGIIPHKEKNRIGKKSNNNSLSSGARTRENVLSPFQRFLGRWEVSANAIANYRGGKMAEIDWDKLSEKVGQSTFLQKQKAISFFIDHYEKILDGAYDDWSDSREPRDNHKPLVDTSDPDFDISGLDKIHYD